MIRWKQAADGYADFGMAFGNPDFVAYAEAYGARGRRVEGADELVPGFNSMHGADGSHRQASAGSFAAD
jgi:acetolactate synthase-1/2/3 large subunit